LEGVALLARGTIYERLRKSIIRPQSLEVLERVGNILLKVKDRVINIEGHTDNQACSKGDRASFQEIVGS
jgi:flagellar motor protein MotB